MKHFDEEIRRYTNHWHTYPKAPQTNAYLNGLPEQLRKR
jgi:hypothetical protein